MYAHTQSTLVTKERKGHMNTQRVTGALTNTPTLLYHVPLSSHVHVQYTTIVTSHKTPLHGPTVV